MEKDKRIITIIGGGASGFAAAICAARAGAHVSICEATGRVAQSIKVTGDGRCNIANARTSTEVYRNPDFVAQAFTACAPDNALDFLESCGLLLRQEAEGRLYPQANKATSVIDALRLSAERAGVREVTGKRAQTVAFRDGRWHVGFADTSEVACDTVIVCCGGHLPMDLLPDDVPVIAFRPVLGPLACEVSNIRGLDKVRVKCALSFTAADGTPVRENGEITFRSYGMSGIAAFNLSRLVSKGDTITIDFLPDFARDESLPYLEGRLRRLEPRSWYELLCGMMLPLLTRSVLRSIDFDLDAKPDAAKLPVLDAALREFAVPVRGIGDRRLCQVHRGGVDVGAIDPSSMQVRSHPGLFICGEALDVDAPCGGYNLQWAWVSGIIAGTRAAQGGRDGRGGSKAVRA